MKRSKKIVMICHCLINANAKVEGLSSYTGIIEELMTMFKDKGFGIIQLPCPEMIVYGIRRWGHVKEQFDTLFYREQCRKMLHPIIQQTKSYLDAGYEIVAVIGVDGSPSCGVHYTCSGNYCGEIADICASGSSIEISKIVKGTGVLIEELKKSLEENHIHIPFTAIDEDNVDDSLQNLLLP